MTTNSTSQNISCLETLILNVLKNSSSEKIANDINIPELDPCFLYNQKLFLYEIKKPITLLICGHLYHHNCIKSSIKINSTYPRPNYNKEIEFMNVNISENKLSNKKAKKLVKKESHILKDLINELFTKPETSQVSVTRKENA
ncbi:8696_t:CDS:2, partial [Cetraspora pellucida]